MGNFPSSIFTEENKSNHVPLGNLRVTQRRKKDDIAACAISSVPLILLKKPVGSTGGAMLRLTQGTSTGSVSYSRHDGKAAACVFANTAVVSAAKSVIALTCSAANAVQLPAAMTNPPGE